MQNQSNVYTTLGPSDLWRVYNQLEGLFRGGGNSESPQLVRANGPRASDFTIIYDPVERCQIVIPDPSKGQMTASVFLPPDLSEQALQIATHEAFPEIIRILQLFRNGSAELSVSEASSLLNFARFLVQRAELHFPYWDDTRAPYSREHDEAFQEINMGIHEKFFSYIGSSFPDLIK